MENKYVKNIIRYPEAGSNIWELMKKKMIINDIPIIG